MKSKFTLTLLIVFSACSLTRAQTQLPNAGLETWANRTVGSFTFEDPANWYSLNELEQYNFPATTVKSTQSHSGTYSAQLFSGSSSSGSLPGLLTLRPIINASGDADLNLNFIPFTARPNRIEFWYKSFPETGDASVMLMMLTKWNSTTSQRDTIGIADWSSDTIQASFIKASVKINYFSSSTPDSMTLIFCSSLDGFNPIVGSEFFIDDINLDYSTGTEELAAKTQIKIYPNPFVDELHIESEQGIEAIRIFDQIGRTWMEKEMHELNNPLDLGLLRSGLYYIEIRVKDSDTRQIILVNKI